jgi:hypothetical protein
MDRHKLTGCKSEFEIHVFDFYRLAAVAVEGWYFEI